MTQQCPTPNIAPKRPKKIPQQQVFLLMFFSTPKKIHGAPNTPPNDPTWAQLRPQIAHHWLNIAKNSTTKVSVDCFFTKKISMEPHTPPNDPTKPAKRTSNDKSSDQSPWNFTKSNDQHGPTWKIIPSSEEFHLARNFIWRGIPSGEEFHLASRFQSGSPDKIPSGEEFHLASRFQSNSPDKIPSGEEFHLANRFQSQLSRQNT